MTKLLSIWRSMSLPAKTYSVALPLSAMLIQVPWLTAWLSDDIKKSIDTGCYWVWYSAVSLIVPWLHLVLGQAQLPVPPAAAPTVQATPIEK